MRRIRWMMVIGLLDGTAMSAAFGTMAALMARGQTGLEQRVRPRSWRQH